MGTRPLKAKCRPRLRDSGHQLARAKAAAGPGPSGWRNLHIACLYAYAAGSHALLAWATIWALGDVPLPWPCGPELMPALSGKHLSNAQSVRSCAPRHSSNYPSASLPQLPGHKSTSQSAPTSMAPAGLAEPRSKLPRSGPQPRTNLTGPYPFASGYPRSTCRCAQTRRTPRMLVVARPRRHFHGEHLRRAGLFSNHGEPCPRKC